jgi:hypothetical protein
MVSGARSERRHLPAHREPLRREFPPHRGNLLQRHRARAAPSH